MCGIAGIFDLSGANRPMPRGILERMAQAIVHRGPDEDGFFRTDAGGLASRRLSIVGLADGRQPISNEDGSISVVFNGELFDYPEMRVELEKLGHTFRTRTDTELLPHLYEEYGEALFEHLQGQFAFCLWDSRKRLALLGRDRPGICPLFWTRRRGADGGEWFLFASEVKALLASGLVPAEIDLTGINHIFSFFSQPGPKTCFAGIEILQPGKFLKLELPNGRTGEVSGPKHYWDVRFPDEGQERNPRKVEAKKLVDEFEHLLLGAVERRLRADVPVVSYLSGGVDSSLVVALASKVLGRPIPTFTVSIQEQGLNEDHEARLVAKYVGSKQTVVACGDAEVRRMYPRLIAATECPVVDTACASLLMLAQSVRDQGFKVALTGEGADEWLAGYPWFKIHRLLSYVPFGIGLRRLILRWSGNPVFSREIMKAAADAVGGHNAWLDAYGLMSIAKLRFFTPAIQQQVLKSAAYADIGFDLPTMARWHPFHRSLYVGGKVMLAGFLLWSKGDRIAMANSVETRYPMLDEQVQSFLCELHPDWKLRGFQDKYLLRLVAERWLPKEIAWRRKAMFRAPMKSFHLNMADGQGWIDQVLSPESLRRVGLFDVQAVRRWRKQLPSLRAGMKRTSVEMGLAAVTSTQLWHHQFICGSLCDLPTYRPTS